MMKEEYTKDRPLRVFTAFSGYDSQCMALERLGIPYVLVGWSEIDKYAIQAHDALFPEAKDKNFGDISKIDWNKGPDFDLFTYSFPCTNLSCAGKQEGCEEGSGTASSLLWECRKAIVAKRPKYLLMENVKALVSQKFLPYFRKWQDELSKRGYSNFVKVLNSKCYGIPQNRERVFMVSILDENASFHFPEPFHLERRLKDILEEDVDERYFLSDKCVKGFMEHNRRHQEKGTGFLCRPKSGEDIGNAVRANGAICPTDNVIMEPVIAASQGRNPENPSDRTAGCPTEQRLEIGGDISNTVTTVEKDCLVVMPIYLNPKVDGKQPSLEHRIYDCDGISTAVTTGFMPKIAVPAVLTPKRNEYGKAVRKKYEAGEIQESRHNMTDLVPRKDGICNTITSVQKDCLVFEPVSKRVDKITTGEKYGRLTVIEKTDRKQGTNYIYKCRCDCGNIVYVSSGHLGKETFSCGCLKRECHTTHGMTKSRIYNIWTLMKQRCCNKSNNVYSQYGGRGIKVCDEWNDNFENFLTWSLKNGYSDNLTIDRINNDGNYEPSNCRWVDMTTQVNNRGVWGEIPYYGIVKDNTGYRAQVTVNGRKVYIGHSKDDIKYLIDIRNNYIDEHNLPCKKNIVSHDDIDFTAESLESDTPQPMILQRPRGNNNGGEKELCPTISSNSFECNNLLTNGFRIRKLTEREVFRLMDVSEEDIDRIQKAGISRSQQYKMAGNSIVVSCLYHIFRKLFVDRGPEDGQLSLF